MTVSRTPPPGKERMNPMLDYRRSTGLLLIRRHRQEWPLGDLMFGSGRFRCYLAGIVYYVSGFLGAPWLASWMCHSRAGTAVL